MQRIGLLAVIGAAVILFFTSAAGLAQGAVSRAPASQTPGSQPTARGEEAPWLDAQETGGIVYFLFAASPRLERYDMQARAWLSPLALDAAPTAFTVDDSGLYVAFGRSVSRYALDGSNKQHLRNTDTDIESLHTNERFLYVNYSSYPSGKLLSVDKLTGNLVGSASYPNTMLYGADIAPRIGKLFARNLGFLPAALVAVTLNSDGSLGGTATDFSDVGAGATRVYVLPGEIRLIDNAGVVYNTADLTYSNRIDAFEDIAFYGDLPIVLRAGSVYAYSNSFQPAGSYTLQNQANAVFVYKDALYSFYGQSAGIGVEVVPTARITTLTPFQPIDPRKIAYTPDNILLGKDEVVYLLSRNFLSVFRWSVAARDYLDTIPLRGAAKHMAYSQQTNRLYLAYPSGEITQIDLANSTAETDFVKTPAPACGLAAAGEFVFVCIPDGTWQIHSIYAPSGQLVSQADWNYYSQEYVWSPANRRMYFLRDGISPNDLHWEEIDPTGAIVAAGESPYHDSQGFEHPIRIAPDAQYVLLGSGRIHDATTLDKIDTLSNDITDAVWLGDQLYTLHSLTPAFNDAALADVQLQKWGQTLNLDAVQGVYGAGGRLLTVKEGLLAVTQFGGAPWFSLWDANLELIYQSPYYQLHLPYARR